jgi:DtxR family Mn-dependent transcriptional regulator
MVNPYLALMIAAAFSVGAAALFWPERGLYWRWEHVLRASDRVLSEDALKYLFDCEYRQLMGTLHGVTGALGISENRAALLLGRLQKLELVKSLAGQYRLTDEGRSQALQIIRIHRLLEHHFSEDTGLDAAAWHREADRLEHRTSTEETEAMAARLGHPRFDPHGDPIPTASGEMRYVAAVSLSDLGPGDEGLVTHIEDEPAVIYKELLAADLHIGLKIRVLETAPDMIRLMVDSKEHTFSRVVAGNVSVSELVEGESLQESFETLSVLDLGESATVVALSAACRGAERRRLMDLGLLPGTEVCAELQGPGGDPTGYRIRGAVIALRRLQAERIQIQRHKVPIDGGAA